MNIVIHLGNLKDCNYIKSYLFIYLFIYLNLDFLNVLKNFPNATTCKDHTAMESPSKVELSLE